MAQIIPHGAFFPLATGTIDVEATTSPRAAAAAVPSKTAAVDSLAVLKDLESASASTMSAEAWNGMSLKARFTYVCEGNVSALESQLDDMLKAMQIDQDKMRDLKNQIAALVAENAKVPASDRDTNQGYRDREAERQRLQGIADSMGGENSIAMIRLQDKMGQRDRILTTYHTTVQSINETNTRIVNSR